MSSRRVLSVTALHSSDVSADILFRPPNARICKETEINTWLKIINISKLKTTVQTVKFVTDQSNFIFKAAFMQVNAAESGSHRIQWADDRTKQRKPKRILRQHWAKKLLFQKLHLKNCLRTVRFNQIK